MRQVKGGPDRSTIILGAIIALLVAALAFVLWNARGGDEDNSSARLDALAAATTAAENLTTYNYKHLDRDFAWVVGGATRSFAKEFDAASEPLRGVVTKIKADAVGTVLEASATVNGTNRATVLLFVDQKITNGTDSKTRTERNRIVMSMIERNGTWLVDDVELR